MMSIIIIIWRQVGDDDQSWAVDGDRRFVVTYYLVDDSVAIFEPPVPNSGMGGGKFLDRTRGPVRKPGSRATYKCAGWAGFAAAAGGERRAGSLAARPRRARDFYVGATLEIASRVFELTEADERTAALQAAALG